MSEGAPASPDSPVEPLPDSCSLSAQVGAPGSPLARGALRRPESRGPASRDAFR